MSPLTSKLNDTLNELQEIRRGMEDALRYGRKNEIVERFRDSFRYERGDMKIKGIMVKKSDDTRFIIYDIREYELFPMLYPDFYGLDPVLNTYDEVEVIIEENGNEKRYIIEKSIRRNDPFLGLPSERSQVPEAVFLKYNNEMDKKLTEARYNPPDSVLHEYIIKILKGKKMIVYESLPAVLLIKLLPTIPEVFSHISYSSRPYTPPYPHKTITAYSSTIKKRRVTTNFKYLTTLILSEIVGQTGMSYIFKGEVEGIDYSDLDKELFYSMSFSTSLSEVEERLWYVVEKILKFLAMYGFLPSDIGFEQIALFKNELRFIDIGGGFDAVDKIGIPFYYRNTLYKNLMNSLESSPHLKICRLDKLSQEVICGKNINPGNSINDELKDILINILEKLLDEKNVKLVIREHRDENNIEKIGEIVGKALRIYSIVIKAVGKS